MINLKKELKKGNKFHLFLTLVFTPFVLYYQVHYSSLFWVEKAIELKSIRKSYSLFCFQLNPFIHKSLKYIQLIASNLISVFITHRFLSFAFLSVCLHTFTFRLSLICLVCFIVLFLAGTTLAPMVLTLNW